MVSEAIFYVLVHDAAGRVVVASIQKVGDELMRDPSFMVIWKRQEGVGDCDLVDDLISVPCSIKELLEFRIGISRVRAHQIIDNFNININLICSNLVLRSGSWDWWVVVKISHH